MMAIASNISMQSFLAPWQRTLQELHCVYFENKQGRAIDNMGSTSGGDAWSDRQVCTCT